MIDECVFILVNLYDPNTEIEQFSTWETMNLKLEKFDDLDKKIIILGGDFNLFLVSVLGAEWGSPVLKISCFKTHWNLRKTQLLWHLQN